MRKTNLFYLEDNKSNFLTFSNYGEYLTGVCLSTNHKIFPSSFICFNLPFDHKNDNNENENIDELINERINEFKKFLMCYYENKLAWLRDKKQENNENFESLSELSYLLEAIYLFFEPIVINEENNNPIIQPTYFGNIVEHDYNGMYNDSICVVDFRNYNNLNIEFQENKRLPMQKTTNQVLHGWLTEELGENNLYYQIINNLRQNIQNNIRLYSDDIRFNIELENNDQPKPTLIEFNCIIPLFNIINTNFEETQDIINESTFNLEDNYKNIPYGIWLTDKKIELYKYDTNISQSWSLVISSKFSPYPLGVQINDENIINNIEKYTYAELLSEQSKILNEFNKTNKNLNILNFKINDLTTRIQNLEMLNSSINNGYQIMDDVNKSLNENSKNSQQAIENLQNQIDDIINRLKWISN